jgi:hypothetical protein
MDNNDIENKTEARLMEKEDINILKLEEKENKVEEEEEEEDEEDGNKDDDDSDEEKYILYLIEQYVDNYDGEDWR